MDVLCGVMRQRGPNRWHFKSDITNEADIRPRQMRVQSHAMLSRNLAFDRRTENVTVCTP
jgi:hypothetical protein